MAHTVAITKGCETLIINLKRVQAIRYWSEPGKETLVLVMNTPDLYYEYHGEDAKMLFKEFQVGLTPTHIALTDPHQKPSSPERLC